ncbi:MAG: hypothetical protein QW589_00315 [Candidatus Bathyarchaeia archaeon]
MSNEFENKVLRCIDKAIGSLGESVKHAIYWHLEHAKNLKYEEIPKKPEEFIKALESIFGEGTKVLERIIVREISLEFGTSKSESFLEVIKMLKQK